MARNRRRPPRRWILGILLLAVSLLTALSLPGPRWGSMTGPFGQLWVLLWANAFGLPGLWLIVAVGVVWGIGMLARWRRGFLWGLIVLVGPLIVTWDAFLQVTAPATERPFIHGQLGERLLAATEAFFGSDALVQHGLALGALALTSSILMLRWGLPKPVSESAGRAIGAVGRLLAAAARVLAAGLVLLLRGCWAAAKLLGCRVALPAAGGLGRLVMRLGTILRARLPGRGAVGGRGRLGPREEAPEPGGAGGGPAMRGSDEVEAVFPAEALGAPTPREGSGGRSSRQPPPAIPKDAPAVASVDLLDEHTGGGGGVSEEEIRGNARLLRDTLASFGIEGRVSEVHPGPIITRYEFMPGVGVTISQIVSRQDDLALAMRAPRVRLLAPIPGKAAVGVEIPNREPALISFREVASTRAFLDAKEPLTVALGKDVSGRPFYASLEKMPHLLIAGTTGSGKSVCMNALIISLLMRYRPDELRLLMIDPKMLEFTVYKEIPHLARPVVTEFREAARALRWLTREMENRYRLLAGVGMRNIRVYRERRLQAGRDGSMAPMPYIVVFVDELADLMLSNQGEIEVPVARLAQMARAVGIHLVLATQRPSVDVITGVIKANFPARIAFQVATRTDSRTVLDANGAESLLGCGDMLFIPPGKAQAHRIHGAFLSDREIERIADYLRAFPPAEPLLGPERDEGLREDGEEMKDPLFNEAMRIVVAGRQGSTSLLQRRLRIGYTRAGRLMDMLERAGIVGPPDGSRAREVLVPPQYLEEDASGAAAMLSPR